MCSTPNHLIYYLTLLVVGLFRGFRVWRVWWCFKVSTCLQAQGLGGLFCFGNCCFYRGERRSSRMLCRGARSSGSCGVLSAWSPRGSGRLQTPLFVTLFLHCFSLLWLAASWSPERRTPSLCDRYSFQSATFSTFSCFSGLPTTCCCDRFRQPEGCASFAPVVLASTFLQLSVLWRGLDSTILQFRSPLLRRSPPIPTAHGVPFVSNAGVVDGVLASYSKHSHLVPVRPFFARVCIFAFAKSLYPISSHFLALALRYRWALIAQ